MGTKQIRITNLESRVSYWIMGRDGIFPKDWEPELMECKMESDPEYHEYKRLQKKFEGKK